jgi:plasmid maintenance system antidote protein VapI
MIQAFSPAAHLRDELKARGWSVDDAVCEFGIIKPDMKAILRGHERITQEWAKRIGEGLGTSAELWINLQRAWDEQHA